MKDIETGVDRLVSLISKNKEIELKAAAKELGVTETVVREWAEFLEEEGMISIEYGLSKVTLSERKLTKHEAESKIKEYHSKKDAFVRTVENTMKSLERETDEFETIRNGFLDLKDKIGTEMDDVKEELEDLKYYEELKVSIDNDIQKQKEKYMELMDKAKSDITHEEKKYVKIMSELSEQRVEITKEKQELLSLEDQEEMLKERLEGIYGIIKNIESKISSESEEIEDSNKHIKKLQKLAEEVESNIRDRKAKIIDPLVKESDKQAEKIMLVQNSILEKVKKKKQNIEKYSEESRALASRFQTFFNKKDRAEKMLKGIEEEKVLLEKQLKELINKAHAFNALAKKNNAKSYIDDLMKTYDGLDHRKKSLRTKMEDLAKLIIGK